MIQIGNFRRIDEAGAETETVPREVGIGNAELDVTRKAVLEGFVRADDETGFLGPVLAGLGGCEDGEKEEVAEVGMVVDVVSAVTNVVGIFLVKKKD